ncbi:MAG: ribosome small subunit-dependent GTPase A [Fimbriimonadaceae bacterium]|nr:ribosome small subunit-dependent GTPase A [Fimbriimonadaceae bacterium]
MNSKNNVDLRSRLAEMDANERMHLRKKAQKIRKEMISRAPKASRYDEESPRARKTVSLEDLMIRLLDESPGSPTAKRRYSPTRTGQVVWLTSQRCRVKSGNEVLDCVIEPDLARHQQSEIAVGDHVWIEEPADKPPMVVSVEPRITRLSRKDPGNAHIERIVAANIEVVVLVVSVGGPPLHPRLIDRYLIAIQYGGAEPLLCVNKVDMLTSEYEQQAELSKLEPYDAMGLPIVLCSAAKDFGIEEIKERLRGRLCVFVGHSGVGKSSLINAIAPDLGLDTGVLMEGYGRGAHTTTASTLHELEGDLRIIDTPGVRSFGLFDVEREDLPWYFPEFEGPSENCKFRDCMHDHEPICGVREAAERGRISPYRYETYLRVLRQL